MESIVEFALYTWVVVSILAVLVQLVRMLRYRRANAARSQAAEAATVSSSDALAGSMHQRDSRPVPTATLDLEQSQPVPSDAVEAASVAGEPVVTSAAGTSAPARPPSTPPPSAPPSPSSTPSASIPSTPASPPSDAATAASAPPERPAEPSAPPAMSSTAPTAGATPPPPPSGAAAPNAEPTTSTLADVLSGVRLPWNLLPTVDESREPSNDRVALITSDGEPADVGADVADELERLGFVITTRGEDTAIATRGHHVLGLQIIPDAAGAVANGKPRFPSAAPTSVALDIWIEA